jgi:hypothetical protein
MPTTAAPFNLKAAVTANLSEATPDQLYSSLIYAARQLEIEYKKNMKGEENIYSTWTKTIEAIRCVLNTNYGANVESQMFSLVQQELRMDAHKAALFASNRLEFDTEFWADYLAH